MVHLSILPPEPQRPLIIEHQSHGVVVISRLQDVIHGLINDTTDGVPGTLVVFQFHFRAISRKRRIKSATMTVSFADEESNTAYDPEVVDLAPQGDLRLFPTTAHVTTTRERTASLQLSPTMKLSFGKSRVVEESTKESSMALIGAAGYGSRNYGGVNGVLWFLRENEFTKDGVAPVLAAAVLLKRGAASQNRRFLADVRVKAEVVGRPVLSDLIPQSLECGSDSPVVFDPLLPPTNVDIDGDNLGRVDLTQFASVRAPSSSPPGGVEAAPMAAVEEGKSWSEGSTRDQVLLNFSKGQYSQLSYKFKRFETLALLNLYNYQHKLVEFDKKINGAGAKMDEEGVNELARLLREYHEAINAFKELAQFERPPADIASATAETLAVKLKEPFYYSSDDATDMIDLKEEAKTDSVRSWIQKSLTHFQTRDIRQTLLTMSLAEIGRERAGNKLLLHPIPPPPAHVSKVADKLASLLVALVGGAFLLAPMYNLTYVQEQKYQLISVVLWVLIFAISVALSSKASNQELLGATAAYAAVLVVFVSQNPSTTG